MAHALAIPPMVKRVGASGQISLGKEYAGRQVLVEMPAEGVWIIKTARIVPDNEAWLENPQIKQRVARAIDWASQHAPEAYDPDKLVTRKPDVKRKVRSA